MIFLADDREGRSCYVNAPSWHVAEIMCEEEGLTLIGEYVETQEGPDWLAPTVSGETIQ